MDPLSVTASIIAILQGGGVVRQSVRKVIPLRNAPDLVASLNNELEELRLLVTATDDVLRDYQVINASIDPIVIKNLEEPLVAIKAKLLELQCLIEYRLTKPTSNGDIRIDQIAWIREQKNPKNLLNQLSKDKMSLAMVQSIVSSRLALNLQLEVSQVRFEGQDLRSYLQNTLPMIAESQNRTEQNVRKLSRASTAIDRHHNTERRIGPELIPRASPYKGISVELNRRSVTKPQVLCEIECSCACHRQVSWRTSPFLHRVLGTLFLNYVGQPVFRQRCSSELCKTHSASTVVFRYYFPHWIMARIAILSVQSSNTTGILQVLRTAEVVPAHAEIFELTGNDKADEVKQLLGSRKISPSVVSCYGGKLLCIWRVAAILLSAGSDALAEDDSRETPKDHAWSACLMRSGYDQLRYRNIVEELFPNPDFDGRGFSVWHWVILGLRLISLEDTLLRHSANQINEPDSAGRTPLAWAALRGDAVALEFLLKHGADPNAKTVAGVNTLMLAARSPSSTCVTLLLRKGVGIDSRSRFGNSALHNALRFKRAPPETVGILIRAGADLDAKDNSGNTPLISAAKTFVVNSKPLILIDSGADVHAQDIYEANVLCYAIVYGNVRLISTLLKAGADHTGKLEEHGSLLHLVAKHSNVTVLELLTKAHLARRDINKHKKDGLTADQLARNRTDVGSEWREAFQNFLASVNNEVAEQVEEIEDPVGLEMSGDEEFEDAVEWQDRVND